MFAILDGDTVATVLDLEHDARRWPSAFGADAQADVAFSREFHRVRKKIGENLTHLSAIRALAQIRKLLKGTAITQINIADKQINTTR